MSGTVNLIDMRLPLSFRAVSMTDQILSVDDTAETIHYDTFSVSIGNDITLNTSGDSTEMTFNQPGNFFIAVEMQVERQTGGMASKWYSWLETNDGSGWVEMDRAGSAEFFSNTATGELSGVRGKTPILEVVHPRLKFRIRHQVDVVASSTGITAKAKSLPSVPADVPSCTVTGFWMWPIQGP